MALDIKALKSGVNIVDIIHTRLDGGLKKKTGANWVGKCYFHDDKSPSLSVDERKQIYKCFGCGKGGDVIDFLMEYSLTFAEAVEVLNGNTSAAGYMAPKFIPKDERPEWVQMVPVPAGAPQANFQHYEMGMPSKTWTYLNEDGKLIGYILRFEVGKKKEHRWLSFCQAGDRREWRWRGFDRPKPLYNLHLFAKSPKKSVLLVEGEKAADAAQLLFGDKMICATWPGGAEGTRHVDFGPLAGRNVFLWPDNDISQKYGRTHPKAGETKPWAEQPGNFAMLDIYAQIKDAAKSVKWIKNSPNFPDKWDIADAHFTKPEAEKYVKDNCVPVPGSQPAPATGKQSPPPAPTGPPKSTRDTRHPFKILGFEKQESGPHKYHFYSYENNTAVSLRPDQMKDVNLMSIASLDYWEFNYPGDRKGIDIKAVVNSLTVLAHKVGPVAFHDFRGRGAWVDGKHIVIHAGNRLIVDGHEIGFGDFDSEHIYEQSRLLDIDFSKRLPTDKSAQLINITKRFNWEREANAYLLAGWIVISPVCGVLNWRPHIWITGASYAGKSTVQRQILKPLLGNVALRFQGTTTESGIRQRIGNDAVPVLFDEADTDDFKDAQRIQQILAFMRANSDEDGGEVAKGTSGQSAKTYTTKSCFAFASIQLQVGTTQDKTRVTILGLKSRKAADVEKNVAQWEETLREIALVITPEYAKQLQARTIAMLPTILENIKVFAKAAAIALGQQRYGDQVAPMLAGAYSLQSEKRITLDEATAYIKGFDWSDEKSLESSKDELLLLQHIMESVVSLESADGVGKVDRNIGEMIKAVVTVAAPDAEMSADKAAARLRRMGIKIEGDGIVISNTSDHLRGLLRSTAWNKNWNKIFMRLEGAEAVESTMFTSELRTRAVRIPLSLVVTPPDPGAAPPPGPGNEVPPPVVPAAPTVEQSKLEWNASEMFDEGELPKEPGVSPF